jgi:uncharacterized protein (TIGR00369 family)
MPKLSDLVEKWLAGDLELAPITTLLQVRPISLGDGEARVEMTASDRLHNNAMGTLHGGVFSDLADVAMGAALATIAAEGESFTTLQMQMSYFALIVSGRLSAHARVIRREGPPRIWSATSRMPRKSLWPRRCRSTQCGK